MRIIEAAVSTVQDAGRPAARRYGFPPSGPLDVEAWAVANAVVGNPAGAAAVEVLAGTFVAELRGRVVLATFDGSLEVDGRVITPWTAVDVTGRVRAMVRRTSYLAVAGGIDVRPVLGSRSSVGERLRNGDVLPIGAVAGRARRLRRPPAAVDGPLRVVPGPQSDRFAVDAITAVTWTVGDHVDRLGVRLTGPALLASDRELLSDGVVPGSIQVPPDGLPIVILADGPTTGGYPKIAVVATVDLGRAGRLRPGDDVRFQAVSVDDAHGLLAAASDVIAASRPVPEAEHLLGTNLVGDAVHIHDRRDR